jgi:RNA polymerase-binding protein DksA
VEDILTEDKWSQARKRLEAEQNETLAEVSRLKEALKYELEYDLEEGDPDLYEREKLLALLRTQEQKLDSIAYALRLMEEGTYGTCEHCGREISSERLDALPHTTLCIECKALTEKGVTFRRAGQSAL